MKRFIIGFLLGTLGGAWLAQAEDITITSYIPSPRGIFEELRAERIRGTKQPDTYGFNIESGELQANSLQLEDKTNGKWYYLEMRQDKLVVVDPVKKKGYIVANIEEIERSQGGKDIKER